MGLQPGVEGFDKFLTPFTNAGFETWVAPSVNNFREVYPNNRHGAGEYSAASLRDGQRLGSTGQLNTIWNDDGEGLVQPGLVRRFCLARRRHGRRARVSIPQFEQTYAQVFHGDATGKLNEAQKEMMAGACGAEGSGEGGRWNEQHLLARSDGRRMG